MEQQADYYTNIFGMKLVAKEKDTTFLANTIDHHSVVLHKGPYAQCLRIGFQIGEGDDLDAFEKEVQGHGIKTQLKKDPEPSISELVTFEHGHGGLQACRLLAPPIPGSGHRAAQARP